MNEQCEKAKLAELKPEEMKTLFWVFGLVSPSDSDIRTRLLAFMEQRHENRVKLEDGSSTVVTIQDLRQEYDKIQAYVRDSKLIEKREPVIRKVRMFQLWQRGTFCF